MRNYILLAASLPLGCATTEGQSTSSVRVPTGVYVNGVYHDVETDYIPHVVQCENGSAPPASLRAQAIAARTFLLSSTLGQTTPQIGDGQQWQVYSCGVAPTSAVYAAVQATTGVFLTYNGAVANGQFVAGAYTGASCSPTSDPTLTQHYVTYNQGLTGSAVHPAPYPLADPNNPRNRGCMGQHLANCLANTYGYDTHAILRFFYGADIVETNGDIQPTGVVCPGYGDWCGSDGVTGGDPNTLYHCSGAGVAPWSQVACSAGCSVQPPGTNDFCATGLSCPGYGDWCGADGIGGDANTLYHCTGAGVAPSSQTTCANGCAIEPPGYADHCRVQSSPPCDWYGTGLYCYGGPTTGAQACMQFPTSTTPIYCIPSATGPLCSVIGTGLTCYGSPVQGAYKCIQYVGSTTPIYCLP